MYSFFRTKKTPGCEFRCDINRLKLNILMIDLSLYTKRCLSYSYYPPKPFFYLSPHELLEKLMEMRYDDRVVPMGGMKAGYVLECSRVSVVGKSEGVGVGNI